MKKNPYLVSARFDYPLLILSPLLALALGFALTATHHGTGVDEITGEPTIAATLIGTFIMAHLFAVFFRSHGNREIFKLYPYRFTIVPVVLFIAMMTSTWAMVSLSVLATFWDVYHSSLQTFGLGRIYDAKAGADPTKGRWLDMGINHVIYIGPIVAGAVLMPHIEAFHEFESVGSVFLTSVPMYAEDYRQTITAVALAACIVYVVYYVWASYQLYRSGQKVSRQKVILLASTAITSVWAWGFNSFGEAFFIMNFFHALQYFAIVWTMEKGNLTKLFRVQAIPFGKALAFTLFIAVSFGYGYFAETGGEDRWIFSIALVVSLMHFWSDGFVWSVRRRQV